MNTTPKIITQQILDLCKRIDATQTPVFVPVKPAAGAIVNECYGNVDSQIKTHGGTIQHGWIIWENPNIIVEGNFHACWVDMTGKLVDITPKADRETEILFLPDSKRIYEGIPIDNIREIITNDPALKKSFEFQEALTKLHAQYSVDGRKSEIPTHELKRIGIDVPQGYMIDMDGLEPSESRQRKIGRNERCPCGSGVKYKKCCGK